MACISVNHGLLLIERVMNNAVHVWEKIVGVTLTSKNHVTYNSRFLPFQKTVIKNHKFE